MLTDDDWKDEGKEPIVLIMFRQGPYYNACCFSPYSAHGRSVEKFEILPYQGDTICKKRMPYP
jgi:hypothetical protein